jgi:glucosamine--fructose-6-phosphate aminotransferase (isomerizing)
LHDIVRALKSINASIISIVRRGDDEISKNSHEIIEVSEDLSEIFTPMLYILPLYLISYYLALIKGRNPDLGRSDDPKFSEAMKIIFPPGTH